MKKTLSLSLLTSAVLLAGNVSAEGEAATATSLWKASAELGFLSTSGTTETETLNAKAMASTDRDKWNHKIDVTVLNSSDKHVATAEKYILTGQSNYKLNKPNFLFGAITYEDDKFNAAFDTQVTEAFGYGRRVIEESELSLDLEIGPGARQSKLKDGSTASETLVRAAAKLDWTVSKSSKFSEVLTIDSGEDNTVTKSITSLATQVNGSLSMKVSYTYKNTSDLPPAAEDTDTETAVTLVYNF